MKNRTWFWGDRRIFNSRAEQKTNTAPIILPDADGCLDSFAAAAMICHNIVTHLQTRDYHLLAASLANNAEKLEAETFSERALDTQGDLESAILYNGGALAALRRISRESMRTSTLIERAGRLLCQALEALAPIQVVVPDVCILDRPTLKILARACLLAGSGSRVHWIWTQPAAIDLPEMSRETMSQRELIDTLPGRCREAFLDYLRQVIGVTDVNQADRASAGPAAGAKPARAIFVSASTVGGACAWLGTQNYDACAVWARGDVQRDVDYFRVLSLTLTNLGLQDEAILALETATSIAKHATLKAHLHYMLGLIWAKRKYDLARSEACFAEAHAALDWVHADDPGDPAMERAWVHNGQAMNALLRARFAGKPVSTVFHTAYEHVCTAFGLVREGYTRDRTYLRFNLLANMSSLMDIVGEHALALDLLTRTFDESLASGLADEAAWLAYQRSGSAILKGHAGDFEGALALFLDARDRMIDADRPICAETLTRSVGTALYLADRLDEAESVFADGLEQAVATRSLTGARTHAGGMASCQLRLGRTRAARETLMTLGASEDVWVVERTALEAGDMSALSPPGKFYGLSTSIPEVDMEDVGLVSISRALRGSREDISRATERGAA